MTTMMAKIKPNGHTPIPGEENILCGFASNSIEDGPVVWERSRIWDPQIAADLLHKKYGILFHIIGVQYHGEHSEEMVDWKLGIEYK